MLDLNYVNTNDRSLRPKISSLIDAFSNLDLTFAVITETWFTENERLQLETENLLLGFGLNCLTLSRPQGNAGYSHGGVAVVYRDSSAVGKTFHHPNPDNFEVLAVQFTLRGIKQKCLVIAAYAPPGYRVGRARACMRYIRDLILEIKNKFNDPYINLAGDFNQWVVEEAIKDYPDIIENVGGPTRKNRTIDRCFSNWHDSIVETSVLPPLETEMSDVGIVHRSEHRVVLTKARIDKIESPAWRKIKIRPYSAEGATNFKEWASNQDWLSVLEARRSNDKVKHFQSAIDDAMELSSLLLSYPQLPNNFLFCW